MKKQRFYPKQVMKRLKGRLVETLDYGEKTALTFFITKGRKFGMSIGLINNAKAKDLLAASCKEVADAILANCTTKIFLKAS